jgi:hypothetical protein
LVAVATAYYPNRCDKHSNDEVLATPTPEYRDNNPKNCSEEVIDEREYKLGMLKVRRIKMDEIKKRLSSIRRKLSAVGRARLLVGLAVALFFVWLVSPAFHGLLMALYVNWPFFLVILVGVVLGGYLWSIGAHSCTCTGPKIPGFDRSPRG